MGELTRVLVDTHVVLWWLLGDPKLRPDLRDVLSSPGVRVFVSAASGWEIATKHRIGQLAVSDVLVQELPRLLQEQRMDVLPITLVHAVRAGALPGEHRDPFDRMIAAQAWIEGLPVMSSDGALDSLGVHRIW